MAMVLLEEGKLALHETERKLRELAGRALVEGQYDDLIHLAELARQLSSLLEALPREGAKPGSEQTGQEANAQPTAVVGVAKSPVHREARRGRYPRFFREGDHIVKVGWSKRGKAEYEHKAPHEAVAIFVDRLHQAGRRFTMDNLLPIRLRDGRDVPAYQAYLSLAWLRACGLVEQHGRKGYSVPSRKDLETNVKVAWSRLTER